MAGSARLARPRTVVAQLLWTLCVLAALVLAVGALLVAVRANEVNALVKAVMRLADTVDLGVFDRAHGIKQFGGSDPATKDALFNWGLGALAWLIVGRLIDRLLRPRS